MNRLFSEVPDVHTVRLDEIGWLPITAISVADSRREIWSRTKQLAHHDS